MESSVNIRRMQVFDRTLRLFQPRRLVDLGAGHGLHAVRATDMGWQVTAVDARTARFRDDPRVTWIQSDIRTFDVTGFDLILCLGLFYHLTLDDQLRLLDRCVGTPLLLDTHVAAGTQRPDVSDEVAEKGYRGRWYAEVPGTDMSSWGNERSFWPTPDSLYRMLGERGFEVLESRPWYLPDRTFFLCAPAP